MKRAVVISAIVLGLTNIAAAETSTKIFQLSATSLPKSLKSTPEKLTAVLAESFGASTSIMPIEDAADMLGCPLTARTCLETIANSANVKRIIFGRIELSDEGAVVMLTLFDAGKGESVKNFKLAGDTTQDLATSLEERLDIARDKPAPPKREDPAPVPLTTTVTSSGPTASTWVMIVGGGITMGAGLGFFASANSLRREIAGAPADTRDDIDRLIVLERAGKRRTEIGAGLLAVGGLVATIGVVRLVMQKRAGQPEKPLVDFVLEKGGGTVLFTMGWR